VSGKVIVVRSSTTSSRTAVCAGTTNSGASPRAHLRSAPRRCDRGQRGSEPASVVVAQFLELSGTLMQAPFIDCLDVEAPVTANLEPW
jgi:hypothetical protein